jgi:broad specificity phosphatase PhoE
MTTLLLARHGQTDWNLEHRWQGDPPLNDTGRDQARSLAQSVGASPLDGLYSSDLQRARETAEIVAGQLGLPVQVDPRLREIDVGEWAGHTSPELERRFPSSFKRYREGGTGWEQGESYEAMVARVGAALPAIAATWPGGRLLLVTHAGVLCAAWLASGRQLADWDGVQNGDLHEVAVEDGRLRWVGVVRGEPGRAQGRPTVFWRV